MRQKIDAVVLVTQGSLWQSSCHPSWKFWQKANL